MTNVTIYLTPALDGVTSEVGYFFNDQWIKVIDAPVSVGGVIGTFGIVTGIDFTSLHVYIPSQTIGGVTYEEALSQGWMETASTFTDNITLIEVAPPPPPPPPPVEIKSIVIPGFVGIVLMFLLRG
jgi:hypothetical protein